MSPRPILGWELAYGPLPEDYCAIDCETSGLDPNLDRILQIGIVSVRKRKAVFSKSYVIDWGSFLSNQALDDLAFRMRRTKVAMERRDRTYPWTLDLLSERGEPPIPVAIAVNNDLGDVPYCIGHYSWFFDFPWLSRFLGANSSQFDVYQNRLYDTCLMTRACLVDMPPQQNELVAAYYRRLEAIRGTPSCRLEDCIDRFGLQHHGASRTSTHLAEYDAWAAHLIFEKHREMSYVAREQAALHG